jgi:hypothetical protein
MKPTWTKRAVGGCVTTDGVWTIRGPIFAKLFWIYKGNNRYTPTGRFADCVSFKTVAQAKRFVESQYEQPDAGQ